MSSIVVLESLKELFPQINIHILKEASKEHANNLDAAVEFILLAVIPFIPTNSSQYKTQMDKSQHLYNWSRDSNGGVKLNELDKSQQLFDSIVNSTPPKRNNNNNKIININPSRKREIMSDSSKKRKWDLSVLVANNKSAKQKGENEANGSNGSIDFSSFESDLITRSSDSFNAEFLEDFVNYAKNNKMDLVVPVGTLTRMLREVSLSAGQETRQKIEELIEMLAQSKII